MSMIDAGQEQATLHGLCEARPISNGASLNVSTWFSGRVALVRIDSAKMAFSRRLDSGASGVDHIAVHIVTSGTMMWRQDGAPRPVSAGGVVVTDLASEFGCTSGESLAEWVVLLINRHQIGSELLAALGDRPTIFDDGRALVAALHGFIAGFTDVVRKRPATDPGVDAEFSVLGDAVTSILQRLLRDAEQTAKAKPRQSQSKVLQICRHIDEDLASPKLAPEMLARQFGLSRASLYRMFEPLGGVARYIRLQKIARAAVQLQKNDARLPLSAIAQSSGFSSADAFVRAFRESYGTTPREFRSLQSAASLVGHASLASWLERNYFWKTNTPRPRAGAQVNDNDVVGDYATAASTAE